MLTVVSIHIGVGAIQVSSLPPDFLKNIKIGKRRKYYTY
jgi:hypothetical protein